MRFSIFYKSTSGVCFSESARKMTQNGGRVVAIGSIFDMNIKVYVRNMGKNGDHRIIGSGPLRT